MLEYDENMMMSLIAWYMLLDGHAVAVLLDIHKITLFTFIIDTDIILLCWQSSHWVATVLLNTCELLERPSKKDGFCFKLFHPLDQSIWATKVRCQCYSPHSYYFGRN